MPMPMSQFWPRIVTCPGVVPELTQDGTDDDDDDCGDDDGDDDADSSGVCNERHSDIVNMFGSIVQICNSKFQMALLWTPAHLWPRI